MEDLIAASTANLSRAQIAAFFSKNAPLTQQQCDQDLINKSVHPASVQGGTSYTVVSDDDTYVVQFRSSWSALDMNLLKCVELAYNGFTPRHQYLGVFGTLHVYGMGNMGGISMYLTHQKLHYGNPALLQQTVSDFAKYVGVHIPHAPSFSSFLLPPSFLPSRKPRS